VRTFHNVSAVVDTNYINDEFSRLYWLSLYEEVRPRVLMAIFHERLSVKAGFMQGALLYLSEWANYAEALYIRASTEYFNSNPVYLLKCLLGTIGLSQSSPSPGTPFADHRNAIKPPSINKISDSAINFANTNHDQSFELHSFL
jgi:hypothetical protein